MNTITASPNTSLRWHTPMADAERVLKGSHDSLDDFNKIMTDIRVGAQERRAGTICVPVGRNELPELMDEIERALQNGESLAAILQRQSDKYANSKRGGNGSEGSDLLFVDPSTGEVRHAMAKGRSTGAYTEDEDAVWDLAYDLQQFLRYRVFSRPEDDSAETEKIIADIKARQASKSFARYDQNFSGTNHSAADDIAEILLEFQINNNANVIDKLIKSLREREGGTIAIQKVNPQD